MSKAWEGGSPHKKTSNITTYHLANVKDRAYNSSSNIYEY